MNKSKRFANITLFLVSIFICLYMTELILELYSSSIERKPGWLQRIEAAKKAGIPFDSRTKFQVLMDLRKTDKNVYLAITPSSLVRSDGYFNKEAQISPLGSISNKTLLACNEYGEYLTFKSDKNGFRNPQDIYDSPIDIALIGDSFTEGLCVKDGEDISGWLRKMTGLNILNLGYGSNGPLVELASMREFAKPYKPKVVLMFYYAGNDMESLPKEARSPILMKYLDKNFTQNLIDKQDITDRVLIDYVTTDLIDSLKTEYQALEKDPQNNPIYKTKLSWAKIVKLKNIRNKLALRKKCSFNILPLFKDILIRANMMAEEWGGKFVFVYLTGIEKNLSEDKNDLCRSRYYRTQRQKIFPFLKELGISFIDIDNALENHDDVYSLYPSFFHGHHNPKGYKFISEQVVKYLRDNELIKSPVDYPHQ